MKSDLGQAIRIGNSGCHIGGFTLRREDRPVGDIAYGWAGVPDQHRVRFPGSAQVIWHRQSAKRLEATQRRKAIQAQENPPDAEWIEQPRYELS